MPLQLMQIKPGIVKDITQYSAGKNGPYWIDGNLVRFKNGYAEKLGGWEKEAYTEVDGSGNVTTTETTIQGIARNMVFWRSITDGEDRIAIGTHNHLYIIVNTSLYDITPLRKTTENLTNPLSTTSGSTTVTITDNSHGASDGDFIVINSATATGGISADTFNRVEGFQITYIDTNSYSIEVPTAATSTATGGGTIIDIKYLIGIAEGGGAASGALSGAQAGFKAFGPKGAIIGGIAGAVMGAGAAREKRKAHNRMIEAKKERAMGEIAMEEGRQIGQALAGMGTRIGASLR